MGRQTIIKWTKPPIDWTGQDVVVVASGPSAKHTDFSCMRCHARVITVNTSWMLAPWADALYASDGLWWSTYNGCPIFNGRKFTSSPNIAKHYGLDILFTSGNNSGLRAIYLALALNARRVLLVGFDMHDLDGAHWHKPHPKTMHSPSKESMMLWRNEVIVAAATHFRSAMIINCTPGSAVQCFPRMQLSEALHGHDGNSSRTDQSRHCSVS